MDEKIKIVPPIKDEEGPNGALPDVDELLEDTPNMQIFVTMKSRKAFGAKVLSANGAFLGTHDLSDMPVGLVKELKENNLFVNDVSSLMDSVLHALAFCAKTAVHLKHPPMYSDLYEYMTGRIEGINEVCLGVIAEGVIPSNDPSDDPVSDEDEEVTH